MFYNLNIDDINKIKTNCLHLFILYYFGKNTVSCESPMRFIKIISNIYDNY